MSSEPEMSVEIYRQNKYFKNDADTKNGLIPIYIYTHMLVKILTADSGKGKVLEKYPLTNKLRNVI